MALNSPASSAFTVSDGMAHSGSAQQLAATATTAAPAAQSAPRLHGVRTLHKGSDGSFVQLALDRAHGDAEVAIKYIPRDFVVANHKLVQREVLNHHQLSLYKHPHLVELQEVILTPRYLGVVMEYVRGIDLQTYLMTRGGTLSEDTARFIFQQLVLTVEFMHKMGKVNRDIKLENMMVVDSGLPLIKLCNFSLSKDRAADSSPVTQAGSALFTAPEVLLNVQGRSYEGEPVDVWSCGVVMHMLLFGCHPFLSAADMALTESEQIVKLVENEVKGQLQMPPEAAGSAAADLLQRVLVPAAHLRYTVADILAHPWFRTSLPPGALQLNASYLSGKVMKGRQSAAEVRKLLASAMVKSKSRSVPQPSGSQSQSQSQPLQAMPMSHMSPQVSMCGPAHSGASGGHSGAAAAAAAVAAATAAAAAAAAALPSSASGPLAPAATGPTPASTGPRIDPATFVIPESVYAARPASTSAVPTAQGHDHGGAAAALPPGASVFSLSEEQLHQTAGEAAAAAALVAMWRKQAPGIPEGAEAPAGSGDMQWQ